MTHVATTSRRSPNSTPALAAALCRDRQRHLSGRLGWRACLRCLALAAGGHRRRHHLARVCPSARGRHPRDRNGGGRASPMSSSPIAAGRRDRRACASIAMFQAAMRHNEELNKTVSGDAQARARRQEEIAAEIGRFTRRSRTLCRAWPNFRRCGRRRSGSPSAADERRSRTAARHQPRAEAPPMCATSPPPPTSWRIRCWRSTVRSRNPMPSPRRR